MIRISLLVLLIVAAAGCSKITPTHNIPVKPDYIHAGVQPGDKIRITSKDGTVHNIEVTAVGKDTIESADMTIYFRDIESIERQSWTEPTHPCGAGQPVGCSIPQVVAVLEQKYMKQAGKFHKACVVHDFCYRHGFATYGVNRAQCDTDFYERMKEECAGGLGILDVKDYSICRVWAKQTYEAVNKHGEPHFRTGTSSTECEYREGL